MTTPEEKELSNQIEIKIKEVESLKRILNQKTKELHKTINDDSEDLFGERKSEQGRQVLMFSERVNPSMLDEILKPMKNSLKTAENELSRLIELKKNIHNLSITGKLF